MEHSRTFNIVFFKTKALLRYLALPAYLLSQNLQIRNIFSFLKIKDKNSKDSAHFYFHFLIIVRHPKVVTLVYSPLTKSLTLERAFYNSLQKSLRNILVLPNINTNKMNNFKLTVKLFLGIFLGFFWNIFLFFLKTTFSV